MYGVPVKGENKQCSYQNSPAFIVVIQSNPIQVRPQWFVGETDIVMVVVVFRFFVLNNEAGLLEYFVNEQSRPQKPRGMLPLAGAVISPSDEDSHTFTVNAISGEQYKLRGGYQETHSDLASMFNNHVSTGSSGHPSDHRDDQKL